MHDRQNHLRDMAGRSLILGAATLTGWDIAVQAIPVHLGKDLDEVMNQGRLIYPEVAYLWR